MEAEAAAEAAAEVAAAQFDLVLAQPSQPQALPPWWLAR